MKYENGDIYNGEWKDDKNSYGEMKYENGDVYIGEFYGDFLDGDGIMDYMNGDVFDGLWEYNSLIIGTITLANGEIRSIKEEVKELTMPFSNGNEYYELWWKKEFERLNPIL